MWLTLRREISGAWRSVRYDVDTRRAAKLAGAFTKEFERSADGQKSRFVPLTGVALLLAGGAAGAFLAISGGVAALTSHEVPYAAEAPVTSASQTRATPPGQTVSTTSRPAVPKRAAPRTPSPSPSTPAAPAPPVLEDATQSPSASTTPSEDPSTSPSPSSSPSSSGAPSNAPGSER